MVRGAWQTPVHRVACRDKEGYFMIKGQCIKKIQDTMIINIYVPNKSVPKYMK